MTIAACYVSHEGVVLGADSTSTWSDPAGQQKHYFNYGQKLFEIGEESSLGIVTWGLGGLNISSHRTQIALFADSLNTAPAASIAELAARWSDHYGRAYENSQTMAAPISACTALTSKRPHDPVAGPASDMRTLQEEQALASLRDRFAVGFCIGGYAMPDRSPEAFSVLFDPMTLRPAPQAIPLGSHMFWGVPNMYKRLIAGCDTQLAKAIISSGFWTGTEADLAALIKRFALRHPMLPIRDAIDFTHACIYSTIKALKFSMLPQVCGGPIEIAVISADRKFRWVRHKAWDQAIMDGEL